jgi:crotonobetainyl-CoA:carnitine CoA-transferase CaiB-like acyl-CoA transferase
VITTEPLHGITVLDLTLNYPGPLATLLLAEQGARVIKLEPPGGDPGRYLPPLVDGISAWHAFLNRGKESVVLDLKADTDRRVARRLALAADCVVEGFRPGVLARLGLAGADLLAARPDLVICSIPGFGSRHPQAGRAMHDLGFAALSGAVDETGDAGGPVVPGTQAVDCAAGMRAAFVIAAHLVRARTTGVGGHVEVPMHDAARIATGIGSVIARATGVAPRGTGLLTGGYACYRLYRCADGRFISIAAVEPVFFMRFCTALGLPGLAATQLDAAAQPATIAAIAALLATRTRDDWVEALADVDGCIAPVLDLAEAIPDPFAAVGGRLFPAPDLDADGPRLRGTGR